MKKHVRLGDMLVEAGLIRPEQLEAALLRQKDTGRRLGDELVLEGVLSEVQLVQVVSNQLSIPWVSLYHVEFSRELLNLLTPELAERHSVIPIYMRRMRGGHRVLFVAMDDPTSDQVLEALAQAVDMPVRPMVAPPSEIRDAIGVYYFGRDPIQSRPPAAAAFDNATEGLEDDLLVEEDETPEPVEARATEEAAAGGSGPHDRGVAGRKSHTPPGDPPAEAPRASRARMITLTLLDGTSVRLPAPGSAAPAQEETLTASDLVAALRARAEGKDVSRVLPNQDWESLFATLLTLLIRKGLIADWEFAQEWKRSGKG